MGGEHLPFLEPPSPRTSPISSDAPKATEQFVTRPLCLNASVHPRCRSGGACTRMESACGQCGNLSPTTVFDALPGTHSASRVDVGMIALSHSQYKRLRHCTRGWRELEYERFEQAARRAALLPRVPCTPVAIKVVSEHAVEVQRTKDESSQAGDPAVCAMAKLSSESHPAACFQAVFSAFVKFVESVGGGLLLLGGGDEREESKRQPQHCDSVDDLYTWPED